MTDSEGILNEDPDLGILRRVAAGDTESYGVLVERHQERLLRLCERMLGDPEEARDAAQEVFIKVYRKAGSYRPKGRVYTWLYRIAVNHCLNCLRRRKVARFFSFADLGSASESREGAVSFEPEDEGPDPERRLAARRRWARTRAWIEGLPAGQRAVLELTKFEGLSYQDTAEVLQITIGAVESRLFRAMRTLGRARAGEP